MRWDRVGATAKTGVAFNFLLTGALIAPLILLDRWTLALFLPEGSQALEIARHLNHISVWSFLFFGVTFVVSGVVRSTGAVIPPLLILVVVFFFVPFALRGARMALQGMKNDVKDWLPKDLEETRDLDEFRRHFLSEQFVLVSWDGCYGDEDDERYKLFAADLRMEAAGE